MKKIYNFAIIGLLALSPVVFTSCDTSYHDYEVWEDNGGYSNDDLLLMAQTLRGKWDGYVQAQGYVNGALVTENFFTEIEFDQYDMTKAAGRGVQSDYASVNAPQADLVRKFSWSIERSTGNIILIYDGDGFKMTIPYNELILNEDKFSGMMYGNNDTEKFSFSRYTLAKKATYESESEDSSSTSN